MDKISLKGIKLIIFDLDGVIYDIVDAIRGAVEVDIKKYGLKVELQDAMQQVAHVLEISQSTPPPQMLIQAKELFDIPMYKGLTVLKSLRISLSLYGGFRALKDNCTIFDGVEDLLKTIKSKNIRMSILSNNRKVYIMKALEKQNLVPYFNQIIGFNEVSKSKPDPEGLLKTLELEHIKPEETLFIGDMPSDILAGKSAHIKTVVIASGLVARNELEKYKPDILLNSIKEFHAMF